MLVISQMTERCVQLTRKQAAGAAGKFLGEEYPRSGLWKPVGPFVPPFIMNPKSAKPVPAINVEQLAATAAAAGTLAILVVEDNRINRVLTMKMLAHLGHTADAVDNGRECMEAVALKHYHLILMDLQMPIMDGFTAAREIRRWHQIEAIQPAPYICALTANVMPKDREESLAAGMDDFLTKPLRLEALKVVVTRVADSLKVLPPKPGH